MDKLVNFLVAFHIFLVSFGVIVVANGTTFSTMCAQTPYPDLCNSLAVATTATTTTPGAINPQKTLERTTNTFNYVRDAALRVTLTQATQVYQFMIMSSADVISSSSNNNHGLAKSAWEDCLELHEDTIEKLNRSITITTTLNDAQTWLSAAIANQQTCLNGFKDFNLSYYDDHHQLEESLMFPFSVNDYSKHLSNSLAINKLATTAAAAGVSSAKQTTTTITKGGRRLLEDRRFPEWVSAADRKLLQSPAAGAQGNADIVVAQDGSGHYKTISEALAGASGKLGGGKRLVVYVKKGVYKENVEIKRSMKKLMFIGDGIDATIVTGSKNAQDGSTTFRSATFAVMGDGFIAKGMTFENTAGPQKHQAVALRSGSDLSVFYGCSFKGYQDTLYVYAQRQFFRECNIYGTIDFIFGDAAAVLQSCNIYLRKPMSNQISTVTAQGRTDPNENTGIVIHNSRITASESGGSGKSYLGRPWQKYSRTVIMKSSIDGVIDPAGWLPWSGNFALSTLYYGEYMNSGAGAGTGGRVKWAGFHVITSPAEAGKFSVGNFIGGNAWIPSSGVPFTSGL